MTATQNKFTNSRNVTDANATLAQNDFSNALATSGANATLNNQQLSNLLTGYTTQATRQLSYNNYMNAYGTGLNTANAIYNNTGTYANTAGNLYTQGAGLRNSSLGNQINMAQQQTTNSLAANNNNLSALQAYLNGSTMPLSTGAAVQEALLQAPMAVWNASLGLSVNNNQALAALCGSGTTTNGQNIK